MGQKKITKIHPRGGRGVGGTKERPDTALAVINTLRMARGTHRDNTCANDCPDLSALKRIADAHSLAILLVHHMRSGERPGRRARHALLHRAGR